MQEARHCLSLLAVAALTCGLSGNLPIGAAHAENSLSTASRITAVYRVELAGFNLGDFRLTTTFRGDDYEMRGVGRFSVLQGLLYEWRGFTASRGRVTSVGPEPAMYAFSYSDSAKMAERLRLTFSDGDVTGVSIVPNKRPSPRTIPVTKEQLEGVLDPMSGAFLSAHSANPNGDLNVCNATLPVFDGRQRFDLVVTPKRSVTVKRTTPAGYGGPAVICKVKFIPIAGYHPDNPAVRLMAQSNEIEVWLVPVKGTQMYVPYRIVLPTLAGYGSAVVTSLQVSGPRRASAEP
ncbi:MAG TPA: DUF3108 domain-containing protein [Methyloceanibacter sp.]|jgi:Protein of unknown function (DUF3108)|nr:DUF3108 domain-containing protein [Methyloceanibacter sp.]